MSETVYTPFQTLLNQYVIEQTLPDNGLVTAFDYSAALADDRTANLLREQRQALAGFDQANKVRSARGLRFSDYEWSLNRPDNFPELQ